MCENAHDPVFAAPRLRMSAAGVTPTRNNLKGDTTMLTKIVRLTAVAAILISSASATFAAPKDQRAPQRVPEPIYFHLATGELG